MVFQQIKVILLSVVAIFRRALCCFSRRRKLSHSASDQLQAVSVIVEGRDFKTNASPTQQQQHRERDWNSWDDSPRTVEEHIEQYRQRIAQPPTPPKEEPEPDFFSELAPVIKPQPKYYLADDKATAQSQASNFSRLQAQTDVPIAINADLEDWEEEHSGGWEDLDNEQTKQLIREKRREMRNQRHNTAKVNPSTIPIPTYNNSKLNNNNKNGIALAQHGIGATRLSAAQQHYVS